MNPTAPIQSMDQSTNTRGVEPEHNPDRMRIHVRLVRLLRAAGLMPMPVLAATPDILNDLKSQLADVLKVGTILFLVAGFFTGGYIVITGAIRVFQDREGGLARFGLGILVTVVMVAFTVYLVGQGTTEIEKLGG